jgi:hypothetical protein
MRWQYWVELLALDEPDQGTLNRLNVLGSRGWQLISIGAQRDGSPLRAAWFIGEPNAGTPPSVGDL